MTPTFDLFGPANDFLQHTLEHAADSLTPVVRPLPNGSVTLHAVGIVEYLPEHLDHPGVNRGLVLSAGIHGDETAPIELLNMLVMELLSGQLQCTRPTLFILGHPAAMAQQRRYIETNLNRLFKDKQFSDKHARPQNQQSQKPQSQKQQALEAPRAQLLAQQLERFNQLAPIREHYDLHTAIRGSIYPRFAVYPMSKTQVIGQSQMQFLAACGIEAILLQTNASSTFSAFSTRTFGADSFTVELGQVKRFGDNDLSQYDNLLSSLRRLLKGEEVAGPEQLLRYFTVTHEIIHSGPNFQFKVADDVLNFTAFLQGTEIWRDKQHHYQVQDAVEYIVFPNPKVEPGQRAGLMLKELNRSALI